MSWWKDELGGGEAPRNLGDFVRSIQDKLDRGEITAKEALDAALFAREAKDDAVDVTIPVNAVLYATGYGYLVDKVMRFGLSRHQSDVMFDGEVPGGLVAAGGFGFLLHTQGGHTPDLTDDETKAIITAFFAVLHGMGMDVEQVGPGQVVMNGLNAYGKRVVNEDDGTPPVDIDKEVEKFSRELDKELFTQYPPGDMRRWIKPKE